MFEIFDFEQGSDDWFDIRCGVVTASVADKILSSTGKPSTQAKDLIYKLAAESVSKEKTSIKQNEWMLRGVEMESEARDWASFYLGKEISEVGFIRSSKMNIGCSPDGLLLDEKQGVEIKCPAPHTHVKYILNGALPTEYKAQVQFSLLVTGFDVWHFISYHPDMKKLHIEVERDEKWINEMIAQLEKFLPELDSVIKSIGEVNE